MKAKRKTEPALDMKRYDWTKARRGRFADRFAPAEPPRAVRILDADLEQAFPDSKSVNDVLRAVLRTAKAAHLVRPRRGQAA